jgi:predicted transcriptional regulator
MKEQTEVVKIRLGTSDKERLQAIARAEYRTFAFQCRLALQDWLEARDAAKEIND